MDSPLPKKAQFEMSTRLLDLPTRLSRIRIPKGTLMILLTTYWVSYWIYVGSLSDETLRAFILPGLFAIWALSMIREILFFIGAVVDKTKRTRRLLDKRPRNHPKVSVIVPAFNEETSITPSMKSVFDLDYPNFEVIFVDDGSVDHTLAAVTEIASLYPHVPVQILTKPNGGKASALNFGLEHATGELVLCVDSDSRLAPAGLLSAVTRFDDPLVASVGGHVYIASTKNLLLRFQQLEYLLGLNFPRRTQSLFGSVCVVPGPVGLFRRRALLEAGGYHVDRSNFAEDAELTIRLLTRGWRVHSDEDLIAYTEGPETIEALLRQRYRWVRGMHQAVQLHWRDLKKVGVFRGRFLATYLLIETSFLPIFNVGMTAFFLSLFFHSGVTELFGIYLVYNMIIDMCRVAIGIHDRKKSPSWFFLILLEKPIYSFMLQTWALLSLFDEWRQEEMTWDKLDRTGQIDSRRAS